MEAEANEKVYLSIGHVHNFLNGFFIFVVVGEERQFICEFRINWFYIPIFFKSWFAAVSRGSHTGPKGGA